MQCMQGYQQLTLVGNEEQKTEEKKCIVRALAETMRSMIISRKHMIGKKNMSNKKHNEESQHVPR